MSTSCCVFTYLPFFLSPSLLFPVDQSMFENSIARQQSPQTSRPGQSSARRSPASAHLNLGSSAGDSSSSGGQQRLKNAINLGKAVGAKVNDLLRRKEPSHLGDVGVTEVNKNFGASHLLLRLLPSAGPTTPVREAARALKTTQDMMISSDPVVSSPDTADSSSFLSTPEKTPPITTKELRSSEEQQQSEKGEDRSADTTSPLGDTEKKVAAETTKAGSNGMVDGLSVPDLINKDPPLPESRAKPCDIWQNASGPDSRLASTPCSGKTPCRISLGEEVLLGNGAPCSKGTAVSTEDAEPHPDLLSFD
uniref:Uncharacterized protein n=1 Tax=Monopterus albus TaxID=43700 RepID=A0A3Q3KFN4_MONAL